MTQAFFKKIVLSILIINFLSACGNVRFSADSSSSGTSITGNNSDANNPGDDGSTAGNGSNDQGDDGAIGATTPAHVSYSQKVPAALNQVDFLLVIDNSASMIAVQQRMASQLINLATRMKALSIDWQMCLTVTTNMNKGGAATGTGSHTCTGGYCTGAYDGGVWSWGVSLPWSSDYVPASGTSQYVLNAKVAANESNLSTIFNNTIPKVGVGDSGTGDERGIKAAYNHFANYANGGALNTGSCYRPGASKAVILLSDEDERSVAGDCSRVNTALGDKEIPACRTSDGALRVLETQDQPANLLAEAKAAFGDTTRFTFNSIIADTDTCQNTLNANASYTIGTTSYYSPHYTGTVYKAASNLTGGGISSLCSQDLSLNLFADKVQNTLSKVTLECAPVAGTLKVKIDSVASTAYSLSGAILTFNTALKEGQLLGMEYDCQK